MADVVRARYKGRDTGEGLPFHAGVPARDLTDSEFDALDEDGKDTVRKSPLYDYVHYTEKAREGRAPRRDTPTEQPADPSAVEEVK